MSNDITWEHKPIESAPETVSIPKEDLRQIDRLLEHVIALAHEQTLMVSSRANMRPREIGIATTTVQKVIRHYLG